MSHHQSNLLTMNKISTLLFLIFLTCTSGVFADSGSSISLNGTWELSYWMQPEEPAVKENVKVYAHSQTEAKAV